MKKSGKVLLGVLSVSALVGTGFAAWVVNNGVVSTASSIVTPTVDTDISYLHANTVKLVLSEKEENLSFSKTETQDLRISYTLKAEPTDEAGPSFNPYAPGAFDDLSDSYVPDVTVSVTPVDSEGNPLAEDKAALAATYINAPRTHNISYTDWLRSDLSETGYRLDLDFSWGSAVGGQNPQEYITTTYATKVEQKAQFEALINALTGVCYKVEFKVGATVSVGTINIADTTNGSLTVKDSLGNSIANGSSVRYGTTLTVEALANPNYKLGSIAVNEEAYNGSFVVSSATTTVAATFTAKEASYSVTSEHATVAVKQGNTTLEASSKIVAGSTFTLEVTPDTNYSVTSITVTQGDETIIPVENVYTAKDSEEKITISVVSEVSGTATITITTDSGVTYKVNGDEKNSEYTTTDALGTEYVLSDIAKASTIEGVTYALKSVKVNDTLVTPVDDAYTIKLEEKDITYTVTFTFVAEGTVTLNADENTTLSVTYGEETIVSSGDKVEVGTVLNITASANAGYELSSVTVTEGTSTTTLTEETGYTYTILGTGAITITATSVEHIDELKTITSKTDGDSFTAIGKVLYKASDNKSILIADQSQGIGYVYTNTTSLISGLSLNDVVKVSGTISSFNNAKQISPSSIEVVENTITPNYSVTEINTYEDYAPLTSTETCGYGVYKFNAFTLDDSYKNFQLLGIVDGESQPVTISNMYSSLEANKALTVTAAICGVKSSLPLAYVISTETYAVDPTLVDWNLSKTTIGVDEELTLATTATPVYSTYSVEYKITSGSEFATLENNVLKGTAAGTVTITGTIKNAAGETILSALTKDITVTADAPVETTLAKYYTTLTKSVSNSAFNKTLNAGAAKNTFNKMIKSGDSAFISSTSSETKCYYDETDGGVRLATSSAAGSVIIKTSQEFSKVIIKFVTWDKKTPTITVSNTNVSSQKLTTSATYKDVKTVECIVNTESGKTNSITVSAASGNSVVIVGLEFIG